MTSHTESLTQETQDDDLDVTSESENATEPHSLTLRLGAELLGTFILVFIGVGIVLYGSLSGTADQVAVALGFGVALFAGVAAVGHVSGGHFNPAVTLGAAITGRTSWADVLPYWVAQILGGIGGAAALYVTIPAGMPAALSVANARAFFSQTTNGYGEHSPLGALSSGSVTFSLAQTIIIEALATAIFVGVILAVTDVRTRSKVAPVAIGLTLAVLVLVASPVTGASLNPARSTATAFFSDSWALGQLWLFWAAPLLGGAVAGLVAVLVAPVPVADDEGYDADDEDEDDEEFEVEQPELAATDDGVAADARPVEWALRTDLDGGASEEEIVTSGAAASSDEDATEEGEGADEKR